MTDLYAILGFDATARECVTAADIKKAYRQEALKWHPDKHPIETRAQAEARFKDLAHAFEILSNDAKRTLYDRGGMAAVERGSAAPPMATSEEEFEAACHRSNYGAESHRAASSSRRDSRGRPRPVHGTPFAFRDPFEIFNSMFHDVDCMMAGMMFGPRHGMLGGFGGSAFDDPFFTAPFGDPFFASTSQHRGGGGTGADVGSGGILFGPSLLSAFGAGSGFVSSFGPTLQMPRHQMMQQQLFNHGNRGGATAGWTSSGTGVHATFTPNGGSHATRQMFSFSGPTAQHHGTSVTVETRIENGQRVTRTVQRTHLSDGTVHEKVSGPQVAPAAAPARVASAVHPQYQVRSHPQYHAQRPTPHPQPPLVYAPLRSSLESSSARAAVARPTRSATASATVRQVGQASTGFAHTHRTPGPVTVRVGGGHH